jgi:hypothetical protein
MQHILIWAVLRSALLSRIVMHMILQRLRELSVVQQNFKTSRHILVGFVSQKKYYSYVKGTRKYEH